ncbi:ATP12 family protein, partial [Rhizobiaceae sp. 2RAB30]
MRDLLSDLEAGNHLSDPDPVKRAQNQMKTPLAKRFYDKVDVREEPEGFAVLLDGKPVRTPGKAVLLLPTERAAKLVADEFSAQGETIDLVTMPVMRLANTAIDGVATDT